uniref:Uncharacterized protein n=1 Tax=Mesocestoides corti TaxID=53468 RepID=A0A5K3FPN4_MESCO
MQHPCTRISSRFCLPSKTRCWFHNLFRTRCFCRSLRIASPLGAMWEKAMCSAVTLNRHLDVVVHFIFGFGIGLVVVFLIFVFTAIVMVILNNNGKVRLVFTVFRNRIAIHSRDGFECGGVDAPQINVAMSVAEKRLLVPQHSDRFPDRRSFVAAAQWDRF